MSGHAAHEHGEGNKTVALVISILALMLAVSEILGQKAQTHTLQSNIEASNLWAFYQAKTIRKTVTESFADEVDLLQLASADPAQKKAMQDRVVKWRAAADRYETEQGKPIKDASGKDTGKFEPGEGRKELRERASEAEKGAISTDLCRRVAGSGATVSLLAGKGGDDRPGACTRD